MTASAEKIPFTIIGSGICGILTALRLRESFPNTDIALLDKESFPGHHGTTRNSGVLHAGIYYDTGSLKHRLCMQGHTAWKQLSKAYNIPLEFCGKYVIATREDELGTLEEYFNKAHINQVAGIRKMTAQERNEISAYTDAIDGFFSPETGILDISSALRTLYAEAQRQGIICLLNTELQNVSQSDTGFYLQTNRDNFISQTLINCAGLGSVGLRQQLGLHDIQNKFVKGNYLKLNKAYYTRRLLYPVPLKNLKGLGVHTSFHLDKIVRFGPNTEDVEIIDYHNREENIDLLWPSIHEKFKGILRADLSVDYAGIRTKILKNEKPHYDFLIQGPVETGIENYFECLGIESPGMTAAPAIAEYVVDMITNKN